MTRRLKIVHDEILAFVDVHLGRVHGGGGGSGKSEKELCSGQRHISRYEHPK
jgi:hypothetical protein